MRVVFKYPILGDSVVLHLPAGATFIYVDYQSGQLCLWAWVDVDAPYEERHIETYMTGEPMDTDDRTYIGTATHNGYVTHTFEKDQ